MLNINNPKLVGLICIVAVFFMLSGLFVTHWQAEDMMDKADAKNAAVYMPRDEDQQEFRDIQERLKEIQRDLEELKIKVARKGG